MSSIKKIKTAFTKERYSLTIYQFSPPTSNQGGIFQVFNTEALASQQTKLLLLPGVSPLVAGFGEVVEEPEPVRKRALGIGASS